MAKLWTTNLVTLTAIKKLLKHNRFVRPKVNVNIVQVPTWSIRLFLCWQISNLFCLDGRIGKNWNLCVLQNRDQKQNISPNCFPQETVAYEYIDYLRHKPIDNITIPYDSRKKGWLMQVNSHEKFIFIKKNILLILNIHPTMEATMISKSMEYLSRRDQPNM